MTEWDEDADRKARQEDALICTACLHDPHADDACPLGSCDCGAITDPAVLRRVWDTLGPGDVIVADFRDGRGNLTRREGTVERRHPGGTGVILAEAGESRHLALALPNEALKVLRRVNTTDERITP